MVQIAEMAKSIYYRIVSSRKQTDPDVSGNEELNLFITSIGLVMTIEVLLMFYKRKKIILINRMCFI